MKTIFSDKATIVIRSMLSCPGRKWVIRDFENDFNIGKSRAAVILSDLRRRGFVSGISSGRSAYSVLVNPKALLDEWTKFYNFDLNRIYLYYTDCKNILPKLKNYFENRGISNRYALTLYTGANFYTNYVNTSSVYCYLNDKNFEKISLDLRQSLDLKELKRGGNFFLIRPYYKHSIFLGRKKIRGYNIVSCLQLYLDLFNFHQRGREHAKYLLRILKERGEGFVS